MEGRLRPFGSAPGGACAAISQFHEGQVEEVDAHDDADGGDR
jgi:hypothetical protein